MQTIHIIASCTDRKRVSVPDALKLRGVKASDASERVSLWWQRLISNTIGAEKLLGTDLYVGDHWSIVRSLPEIAASVGFKPILWVASAGYGLVRADSWLRPYSATFATGHPDSVFRPSMTGATGRILQTWWKALAQHSGDYLDPRRSINHLAQDEPRSVFLFVGSPDYVMAVEEDWLAASQEVRRPEQMVIVSISRRFHARPIGRHVVPCDARLQQHLGGARGSLHARLARKILSESREWPIRIDVLKARFERLLNRSRPLKIFAREPMTDEQVAEFIRIQRRQEPGISCSRLLRALRDSGRACEQSRFKGLHLMTVEADYAG